MGKVFKDPHGIDWFEVARDKYVAGSDYSYAIEVYEEMIGVGWTIEYLDSVGCGPLEFDRYESRPKMGEA